MQRKTAQHIREDLPVTQICLSALMYSILHLCSLECMAETDTQHTVLFMWVSLRFLFATSNSVYHFSRLHTTAVIQPKLPLFNAVFHLIAFPFTKLLPALISNTLTSAGPHDCIP